MMSSNVTKFTLFTFVHFTLGVHIILIWDCVQGRLAPKHNYGI